MKFNQDTNKKVIWFATVGLLVSHSVFAAGEEWRTCTTESYSTPSQSQSRGWFGGFRRRRRPVQTPEQREAAIQAQNWNMLQKMIRESNPKVGEYFQIRKMKEHPRGREALNYALWMKRPQSAIYLIEAGAPVNFVGTPNLSTGQSPLHWAISQNYPDVVVALIKAGADPSVTDCHNRSAAELASQVFKGRLTPLLLAEKDVSTLSTTQASEILITAVFSDLGDLVEKLLQRGANPNQTVGGYPLIVKSITEGKNNSTLQLIKGGVTLDYVDKHGMNLILLASEYADLDVFQLLLEKGLDPSKRGSWATALMRAARGGNLAVVNRLLELGADPFETAAINGGQWTALTYGARFPEIVSALLSQGIEVQWADIEQAMHVDPLTSPESIFELLDHFHGSIPSGRLSLFNAVKFESPLLIDRLIERGADTEESDSLGFTALVLAMEYPKSFTHLLERGADPSHADQEGKTILVHLENRFERAQGDQKEVFRKLIEQVKKYGTVELSPEELQEIQLSNALLQSLREKKESLALELIEKGANVNRTDGHGLSPLQMASWGCFPSVIDALVKQGASYEVREGNFNGTLLIAAISAECEYLARKILGSTWFKENASRILSHSGSRRFTPLRFAAMRSPGILSEMLSPSLLEELEDPFVYLDARSGDHFNALAWVASQNRGELADQLIQSRLFEFIDDVEYFEEPIRVARNRGNVGLAEKIEQAKNDYLNQ